MPDAAEASARGRDEEEGDGVGRAASGKLQRPAASRGVSPRGLTRCVSAGRQGEIGRRGRVEGGIGRVEGRGKGVEGIAAGNKSECGSSRKVVQVAGSVRGGSVAKV